MVKGSGEENKLIWTTSLHGVAHKCGQIKPQLKALKRYESLPNW